MPCKISIIKSRNQVTSNKKDLLFLYMKNMLFSYVRIYTSIIQMLALNEL